MMENNLKRKLADDALTFCLGVNDVQYLLRCARADIEGVITLPVPRR
jgi:hypothetical protein